MTEQYKQQQHNISLMNQQNRLLKYIKDFKKQAKNRITRIVNSLCQDYEIMRRTELRIIKRASEYEVEFYRALLQRDLRKTLTLHRDMNAYLNDHLTEIIDDQEISTGDLKAYADIVLTSHKNNIIMLEGLFKLFNEMEKNGLPKYWV